MYTLGATIGRTYPNLVLHNMCDKVLVISSGIIGTLKIERHFKGGCFLVDHKDCTFKVTEYKNRGYNAYYRMEITPRTMTCKQFLTSNWLSVSNPQPFMFTVAEHRMFNLTEKDINKEFYVKLKRQVVGWEGYNFDINLLTGDVSITNQNTPWLK